MTVLKCKITYPYLASKIIPEVWSFTKAMMGSAGIFCHIYVVYSGFGEKNDQETNIT